MLIISRYTEEGNYPALADKLRASCERFGLRYDVATIKSEGSWRETERHKPNWILTALADAREAVLWLDCDCEIIQMPGRLLGTAADFAAYNWHADAEASAGLAYSPDRLRVSGGVLLFAYTAPVLELLIRWLAAPLQPDDISTDQTLERVYNGHKPPVQPLWLPKSYNRMDSTWPSVEPVINHTYKAGRHKQGLADDQPVPGEHPAG